MTRKSKQPGGHNPLTYAETKRLKSSGYGTQSTRLTSDSQLPFGHCCLSLSQIEGDAVATPSGHIYSREAIVQYLLTKNQELKGQKAEYDRLRVQVENRRVEWEEKQQKKMQQKFQSKDQGAMSNALVLKDDSGTDGFDGGVDGGQERKTTQNSLAHVSYWLASSQPGAATGSSDDFDYENQIKMLPPPPPDRPPSPMSGEPLKLKQLIPLSLNYEKEGGALCSVSHKRITTQPAVVIRNSGQVMLKSVFDELAKPSMTCPITGKKFKDKDVITLIKGKSGFAASGNVEAKKYNPTLT